MKTLNRTGIALVATLLISITALASEGPPGQHHDHSFSAGKPCDTTKPPSRIVQVTMIESDGKMLFLPNAVEVKKDEQVKFMLRNNGELDHEFILATTAENLKHAETMRKNPDMEHDDANGKRLAPKQTDQIVWKFSKAGDFEYSCLIPGHREAGMIGTIVVR
jgi:uncharacterized cupredoxin-like copper-binding protein